ncbi:MAG: CBS domain-containing protein [Haloferacaceae archaeon]
MEDVFVGRLMSSPPLTVESEATLREAGAAARERGVGSLLVVEDGELTGILTRTDFVRAAAAGRDPEATSVSAYATEVVETTTANTPIVDAADQMTGRGIHHLPVVDPDEGVVGIITSTDLTAYLSGL